MCSCAIRCGLSLAATIALWRGSMHFTCTCWGRIFSVLIKLREVCSNFTGTRFRAIVDLDLAAGSMHTLHMHMLGCFRAVLDLDLASRCGGVAYCAGFRFQVRSQQEPCTYLPSSYVISVMCYSAAACSGERLGSSNIHSVLWTWLLICWLVDPWVLTCLKYILRLC